VSKIVVVDNFGEEIGDSLRSSSLKRVMSDSDVYLCSYANGRYPSSTVQDSFFVMAKNQMDAESKACDVLEGFGLELAKFTITIKPLNKMVLLILD